MRVCIDRADINRSLLSTGQGNLARDMPYATYLRR
jgi:hypothetical protein